MPNRLQRFFTLPHLTRDQAELPPRGVLPTFFLFLSSTSFDYLRSTSTNLAGKADRPGARTFLSAECNHRFQTSRPGTGCATCNRTTPCQTKLPNFIFCPE